ncbi:hypothetical protein R6Q59_021504 [Mikania micrantha]
MEAILQAHKTAMPERQVLVNLAEKFSKSEERLGKIEVQMKQVWNWFQNRRYAIRAKAAKAPGRLNLTQMAPDDSSMVKGVPQVTQPHAASSVNVRSLSQAPQHPTVPSASVRTFPQALQQPPAFSVQSTGRVADNSQMEYEAKSARDGAWYDVSTFLSHRSLETGDPEVFVRFAGFGAEEDEWVNIRKNVRQRSLPCEASECVAVLPADLILCFQEGKEQALYFDAHVLDAQRRRHDVRGCRCRFLVRYDHDQSEEIVALRKICRRPETDYRLQQLHAVNESITANQNKNGANNNMHTVSTLRVYPPAEAQSKQPKAEPAGLPEAPQKRQRLDSTVSPEGSQMQIKVEPVMANVPQNQQIVQPAVRSPRHGDKPSDQASLEPGKTEPVVPVLLAQGSGECQNVSPVMSTYSDEVPVELQKVQPLMSEPITKVTIEPHKVEADMLCSSEAKQELQSEEHDKTEPVLSSEVPEAVEPNIPTSAGAPCEGEPELTESHKEPVVSGSSVKVPAELRDVQPDAPDQPHAIELETKTEEPMLHVSVNEPNVVEEATETKTKDPVVCVSSSDPTMVQDAKTVQPVVPVDPDVVQDAKTMQPVVPVDPDVVQEPKTEEPAVPVNPDVTQEAKTEEPVDPDVVALEAKTKEEPVVPDVDQEAKTEESVVTVNDPMVIECELEHPGTVEINEDKHANVAENVSDSQVENLDLTQENAAVAMEEG